MRSSSAIKAGSEVLNSIVCLGKNASTRGVRKAQKSHSMRSAPQHRYLEEWSCVSPNFGCCSAFC